MCPRLHSALACRWAGPVAPLSPARPSALATAPCPPPRSYGNDFDPTGKFTPGKVGAWHWDKRDWTVRRPWGGKF